MNKYDDIKQFKDKIDMQGINYKEISEGESNNSGSSWALIKQMSSQENNSLLENGRTTQPTPQPVSASEFAEPNALNMMSETQPAKIDVLQHPKTTTRPAIMQSLFPAPHTAQVTASKSITEQPTATQPVAKVEPAPPISSSPFDKFGSDHKTEFKHIFSPKEPQTRQADFAESSRDIPLQSLLESIALCR